MQSKWKAVVLASATFAGSSAVNADVLIAGAPGDSAWLAEVRDTVVATGLLGGQAVDIFEVTNGTPSLAAYDAVLTFTDTNPADPAGWGNALADFVDSGGGVVQATFSWNIGNGGRWFSGGYSPLLVAGQSQGAPLTLGTVHEPSHPVMNGVTSFSGGSASYHNTGGVATGAVRIADWSNGRPLIAEMPGFAGGIVGLNFYPPSDLSRVDFWTSSTDGAVIMANALNYVMGASGSLRLRLTGLCPGTITLGWSNATPNRQMGLVFALNAGGFIVPGGPCSGTMLGLGTSQLQLVDVINTGTGEGSVDGRVGTSACGGNLQLVVVDASPCTTSNVARIP